MKTIEEIEKYRTHIARNSVMCKCGRKIAIPYCIDKKVCDWCGHYVYRTPELEFKYKLEKEIRKNEKSN